MNINFGLLPPGKKRDGKRRFSRAERRRAVSDRALAALDMWLESSFSRSCQEHLESDTAS